MGIHQLSVNHDEQQDRLLLRINTREGEEIQFWLTRRMVVRLLPAIELAIGTLEAQRPEVIAPDAPTRQMLTEMQHEAFVQQADFKTPYTPPANPQLPFGESPLLVTDAQLSVQSQKLLLVLQDHSQAQGRQCQLQLPPELAHGLLHLTQQAMTAAEWSAVVPVASANASVEPESGHSKPRYTH